MYKKIATGAILCLIALPAYASAQVAMGNSDKVVILYQQLIQLLQQELSWLQNNTLSVTPSTGSAPLTVIYELRSQTGTEAIDFGDGHSTGSSGCMKNSRGFCDLSKPLSHTYMLPGTYTVTLYRTGADKRAQSVMTTLVNVTK